MSPRPASWDRSGQVELRVPQNDTTNAFKAYRRTVLEGCRPPIAPHFNLTVELPLKAMVRAYSWAVMFPKDVVRRGWHEFEMRIVLSGEREYSPAGHLRFAAG